MPRTIWPVSLMQGYKDKNWYIDHRLLLAWNLSLIPSSVFYDEASD